MAKTKKPTPTEAAARDTVNRLLQRPYQIVDIDKLIANPLNPNHIDGAALAALETNIQQQGFLQPILVYADPSDAQGSYRILDGHHRVQIAAKLGMKEVPCVLWHQGADGAPPAVVGISMNQLRGEVDTSAVAAIFDSLAADGVDFSQLLSSGYSEAEINGMLAAIADSSLDEEDVLEGATHNAKDEEEDPTERPAVLELTFRSTADLKKARRALKRAAGKGNDLGDGLLRLLEGED